MFNDTFLVFSPLAPPYFLFSCINEGFGGSEIVLEYFDFIKNSKLIKYQKNLFKTCTESSFKLVKTVYFRHFFLEKLETVLGVLRSPNKVVRSLQSL